MIAKLSELGVTSEMAYAAGTTSIGLTFLTWALSKKKENAGTDRADRWGIFVGQWAPTFFALGIALRLEENSR
ncbi:hypothetical protein GCM10007079_18910 [Nocardiopsis terrae]|uniref:Uncharacterized protein n=1 Tax=Nocardiopsis terrae TaxID=372655 RepID=A0ABR9HHJ1_9ACTN|nr:hypothetical protein [Nocardiopsis terrae]MBE1458487.1 hypothetical protein [Nocardiopsis terrae]GHC80154.1 hypothetical protein GCM10007079_18910 [Nocardiopsis terrae]